MLNRIASLAASYVFSMYHIVGYARFKVKVQGFFICHIIVIQGIIRSEM